MANYDDSNIKHLSAMEHIRRRMQITQPLLLEAIPLTLEEIFIYELGGADYAVKDIVL